MEKTKQYYLVDVALAVSFILSAVTGLVRFFFLPSGVKQGSYQEFLGITKYTWNEVHQYSGIAMVVLVLIHLILHWNWIVCMTKSMFRKDKPAK